MAQVDERRKCRRFSIPGARVKYKKAGLLKQFKGFSKERTIFNVGEDGLAFLCAEKFDEGDNITLELVTPNDPPLVLLARIKWQGDQLTLTGATTGAEFNPFGTDKGCNSPATLEAIRKLEEKYGNKAEAN
jgi:hypothetical protein